MSPAPLRAEDLQFVPPAVPDAVLARWTRDRWGVSGTLTPLKGERDQNRLVATPAGERYVLKVSAAGADPLAVDLQTQALLHLASVAPDLGVPRVVAARDDRPQSFATTDDGQGHVVRLLTFLDGCTYEDREHIGAPTLRSIGRFQGRLCVALGTFVHEAQHQFMPWDTNNGLLATPELWAGGGADVLALLAPHRDRLVDDVLPRLSTLRAQVIHNDAHRGNLLRKGPESEELAGLIDFGDLVHAPLVADLAASAATFVAPGPDPAAPLVELAAGFHAVLPLVDDEVALFVDLVTARLTLAVLLFDLQLAAGVDAAGHVRAVRPVVVDWLTTWLALDRSATTRRLADRLGEGTRG